jgi:ankyrin repeat protein
VRHILEELPETLDETYGRMLRNINKANRAHAHRLMQCLTVAVRPLRLAELAEVLAVDFGTATTGGTSKLNTDWRWEDQRQAVLSTCSSLISVVDQEGSQIIQLSHFSVKEYLMSPRLAYSSAGVSHFHIFPESAHAILAKACLGVLLRLDDDRLDRSDVNDSSPLAKYAAEHWVAHAQYRDVSSHVRNEMEELFDPAKALLAAWLRLHDIDGYPSEKSSLYVFGVSFSERLTAAPLYYAAICGFHDLAEHLIVDRQEHVNAHGGYYVSPLGAALAVGHFEVARLLYEHHANVDARGYEGWTLLHGSSYEHRGVAEWLLRNGANPNIRGGLEDWIPLHLVAENGRFDIAEILLQFKADNNAQDCYGRIPLHVASVGGHVKVARLLLEHGSDVNFQDGSSSTPLHTAVSYGRLDVARLLVEHGATVDLEDDEGKTAVQIALERGYYDFVKWLSDHASE